MKVVDLHITNPTSTLQPGNEYDIKIDDTLVSDAPSSNDFPPGFNIAQLLVGWVINTSRRANHYPFSNNEIKVTKVNPHGLIMDPSRNFFMQFKDQIEQLPVYNTRFDKNHLYTITVLPKDRNTALCTATFSTQQDCTIEYINKKWDGSENVQFYINDQSSNMSTGEHRVLLRMGNDTVFNHCYNLTTLADKNKGVDLSYDLKTKANISNLDVYKDYTIEIRDSCKSGGAGEEKACEGSFPICATGDLTCQPASTASGSFTWGPGQGAAAKKDVCKPSTENGKTNFTCSTAIGDMETEPTLFIKRIFGFFLGIAGGIALLLIIYSGYQLMMAQGNPEKIQGAKETLTSAIVGLLFIIFSVVILQIIGVDILRIPGFGK